MYEELSNEELATLLARVEARLEDPSYVRCDNNSNELCCDDCGVYVLRAEVELREYYSGS